MWWSFRKKCKNSTLKDFWHSGKVLKNHVLHNPCPCPKYLSSSENVYMTQITSEHYFKNSFYKSQSPSENDVQNSRLLQNKVLSPAENIIETLRFEKCFKKHSLYDPENLRIWFSEPLLSTPEYFRKWCSKFQCPSELHIEFTDFLITFNSYWELENIFKFRLYQSLNPRKFILKSLFKEYLSPLDFFFFFFEIKD